MSQPDLNLLPVFVAVAETWSLSAAARKLGLPKSSVSRGLTALEASLGVKLLHRSTRKVSLTTAGTAFYEKVRPWVAALADLTASLPEQEVEPSGTLRFTTPVDLGHTFLGPLVARFCERYPAIQLDIRPTNRFVDLEGEGFDAALRVAVQLTDSTLVARRLCGLDMGLYAAPTYLARRGSPQAPEAVAAHDWLSLGPRELLPHPLTSMPRPRLVTDDLLFLHRALQEGLGLGLLPTYLAQQDVLSGRLVRLLESWSPWPRNLYFVHPRSEHVPRKVVALRDFLVTFLKAHPLTGG
jgi:DNA-binding transcriptional LysR family regulator